jgi:glycerol kinase
MFFLALDQSTSASKALLFDRNGKLLDRESKNHQQHYPQPGWVEHDAEEIWQNCLEVLRVLLERHPEKWDAIESLSISNQRETTLVWNRETGLPRHRAIVWQCRRSTALCEAHFAAGSDKLIQEKTGLRLDAYFSGSKLQWMAEHHEGLAESMASGETVAGTIDAYLVHRLTKGAVLATDHTNASRTLLFDIGKLQWDEELCALFQVPSKALPEVREPTASFGTTDLDGFFPRPLPIQGIMGDSQASLFAQRCYEPGAAKVTFGTGSSILLNIGAEMRFSERGVVTTLAWVHDGVPTYAFEGIIISSASTLEWLKNQLGIITDPKECETLARELEDNQGVYLVPAFTGLGLPHWKPNARAAIVGLSSQSDRRHIVRAALESIAYQIQDALEAMRADAGVELRRLHGDGGPTANRFLMQFVADLAAVELHVNTMSECSPLGAVLAGMLGRGLYASMAEIAAAPRQDKIYAPEASPEAVSKAFDGWQEAVKQVLVTQS